MISVIREPSASNPLSADHQLAIHIIQLLGPKRFNKATEALCQALVEDMPEEILKAFLGTRDDEDEILKELLNFYKHQDIFEIINDSVKLLGAGRVCSCLDSTFETR